MTLEAPAALINEDAAEDRDFNNYLLPQADLLDSTVERIKLLRGKIAELNGQISDAYEEADNAGVPRYEVRWLLAEDTMSQEQREERAERDARREQLWASLQHAKQKRLAAEAAKAQAEGPAP